MAFHVGATHRGGKILYETLHGICIKHEWASRITGAIYVTVKGMTEFLYTMCSKEKRLMTVKPSNGQIFFTNTEEKDRQLVGKYECHQMRAVYVTQSKKSVLA